MAGNYGNSLNLILLGKTGHGKSATGNTILGLGRGGTVTKFTSSAEGESCTKKLESKSCIIKGRTVSVIDTPGAMDTKKQDKALDEISKAVVCCPEGFNAFLIVLKFGTKMTPEETEAIVQLKNLFGIEMTRYTIIVVTHGRDWEDAEEELQGKYKTFAEFMKSQKTLSSLLDIERWVLIENRYKEKQEMYSADIIRLVDEVMAMNDGFPYTNQYFLQAQEMKKKGKSDGEQQKNIKAEMKKNGGCFPADAMVILDDLSEIKMEDLRIGHKVLTGFNDNGASYSEVFMFGHAKKNVTTVFHCIETEDHHTITLTPDHHVFINESQRLITKAAKDIKIGDALLLFTEQGHPHGSRLVLTISTTEKRGLYAPFTMIGSIVVNGILASCYIDMVPPGFAHPLLWPVRQLYKISPSTLSAINKNGDDGIPQWIRWCIDNLLS